MMVAPFWPTISVFLSEIRRDVCKPLLNCLVIKYYSGAASLHKVRREQVPEGRRTPGGPGPGAWGGRVGLLTAYQLGLHVLVPAARHDLVQGERGPPMAYLHMPLQRHTMPKILSKYSQKRNISNSISYIHVSVSDLYIPMVGLPILLKEKRWTDRSQTHACGNWGWGHTIPFLGIRKSKYQCVIL